MECQTKKYNNRTEQFEITPKKTYPKMSNARRIANTNNRKSNQVFKLVPYECKDCGKFHIGRSKELNTDVYRDQLKDTSQSGRIISPEQTEKLKIQNKPKFDVVYDVPVQKEFKILGKIDLPK